MKNVGLGFRECDFVTRDEKRSFLSKGGCLYLDQSLAAVYVEGQDVEAEAVTLSHRNMFDLFRKLFFPKRDSQAMPMNTESERFTLSIVVSSSRPIVPPMRSRATVITLST